MTKKQRKEIRDLRDNDILSYDERIEALEELKEKWTNQRTISYINEQIAFLQKQKRREADELMRDGDVEFSFDVQGRLRDLGVS